MKTADVLQLTPQERLLYWVSERESIRRKRALCLAAPWTDDVILQTYRFCNVRRMDDKVSQWLYTNWYKPYRDHPNMLVACALARFFNRPETLAAIGFPLAWKPETIKKVATAIREQGQAAFNGAYMVRGGSAGGDKITEVIDDYCQPLVDSPPKIDTRSIAKSVAAVKQSYGMGSFMAGQIVADLRWAWSGAWSDKLTWAAQGPGSTRGLNRLLGRPVKASMKPLDFQRELGKVIELCLSRLPSDLTKRLEAIDYQNCLCESDKYNRALQGEGKPKQQYPKGKGAIA